MRLLIIGWRKDHNGYILFLAKVLLYKIIIYFEYSFLKGKKSAVYLITYTDCVMNHLTNC